LSKQADVDYYSYTDSYDRRTYYEDRTNDLG